MHHFRKVFAFAFILFMTTVGLKIVSPQSLVGYINSPTLTKFLGPQDFTPQNATALYYAEQVCNKILRSGENGGTEIGNYTGYILVAKSSTKCTYEQIYKNLYETGALAIVLLDRFPTPGILYNVHYGSLNKINPNGAPILQVSSDEFSSIQNYMKTNNTNDTIIEISSDKNSFKDMYESVAYLFIIRILLPLLFFPTSILSFYSLFEVIKGKKTTMTTTKIVIYTIEGLTLILNGFFTASSAQLGTDFLAYNDVWFFYLGFPCMSMFSTTLVSIFYKSMNTANLLMHEMKDIFKTHYFVLPILFVAFLLLEIASGVLNFAGIDPLIIIAITAFTISVCNIIAAIFMIRQKKEFYLSIEEKAAKFKGGSEALIAMCEHTGRWLVICVLFMAFNIIVYLSLSQSFILQPSGYFYLVAGNMISRWGISFTQIVALRWNYVPKKKANGESNTREKGSSSNQHSSQRNSGSDNSSIPLVARPTIPQ